ncbi:lITAF domain-containing protein [Hyperolius riggenbachi]|uniref:lITAF domain-containing protein n=1 Tax=Hyperolius riggenbachi TaxID=752182 RepID=UPI0035A37195
MSSERQQPTGPGYPAEEINLSILPPPYVVNMDPQQQGNQFIGPGYPPANPGMMPTPVYPPGMENQAQFQAGGFNPAVYAPQPPPYNEGGNQPPTVLMPQIVLKTDMRDTAAYAVCPACNVPCMTRIEYKSGCLTTLLCCLLFFFGCMLGCCLIPCCINSCKDVNHYCPNCQHLIHRYKRI